MQNLDTLLIISFYNTFKTETVKFGQFIPLKK
jgi:hypothetical protein